MSIIRALSDELGHTLPYNSLGELRSALGAAHPSIDAVDVIKPSAWRPFGVSGNIGALPLTNALKDFYLTNSICRASDTMAKCSSAFSSNKLENLVNG